MELSFELAPVFRSLGHIFDESEFLNRMAPQPRSRGPSLARPLLLWICFLEAEATSPGDGLGEL